MIAYIFSDFKEDAVLVVKVKDEGIGLTEEDLDQLFKPFSKVATQNSGKEIASNGFGLSVCRQICN